MEEIYVNARPFNVTKPPAPAKILEGSDNSKKCLFLSVIILGLLNALQLAGLIYLGIHNYYKTILTAYQRGNLAADFSTNLSSMTGERNQLNTNLTDMAKELTRLRYCNMVSNLCDRDNLTECLLVSNNKLSLLIKERDLLHTNLTAMTKQLTKVQESTCPIGWTMFRVSCYLLSTTSGSWDEGRKDCKDKGADLLVINNADEKEYLATFIKKEAWIGLNDRETEGSWKWVDGTSLLLTNWGHSQPDNGGTSGKWGEEDCAHIHDDNKATWNDLSCTAAKHWICEMGAV